MSNLRLAHLPVGAKLMLTAFLALLGCGYLVAVRNIYEKHHEADLEPAMSIDDLRRTYHGLEKTITSESRPRTPSVMELMVKPGGPMRAYLEQGGPKAVRTLMHWLETGAEQAAFTTANVPQPGDPAPRSVIARQCIRCHNATDGEMADVPFATGPDAQPDFNLVMPLTRSFFGQPTTETEVMQLPPTGRPELIHITHAHILSMPVFTIAVGILFFLTGLPPWLKTTLGPLPMLALCADIAGWWLARAYEPAIYLIAGAGAVFGLTYGVQILSALLSLWFGRRNPRNKPAP